MQLLNSLVSVASASAMLINMVTGTNPAPKQVVLAQHSMSLQDRYPDQSVNEVFKDNILLSIAYLDGRVKDPKTISWGELNKPFTYEFSLEPKQTFAFHNDVLSEYSGKVAKTTNAHFNSEEGFKSDGYLVGDGVCHLASLLYWVSKDGKLQALAPTNHDFHVIPDIPKDYGVAIYDMPGQSGSASQNLYITNTLDKPIIFHFAFDGQTLKVTLFTS